uniref:Uncharacterized protein n=1 Tax=Romanomermis culicivorax TaxID=13658 RepID=A0A915I6W2_ROMCU
MDRSLNLCKLIKSKSGKKFTSGIVMQNIEQKNDFHYRFSSFCGALLSCKLDWAGQTPVADLHVDFVFPDPNLGSKRMPNGLNNFQRVELFIGNKKLQIIEETTNLGFMTTLFKINLLELFLKSILDSKRRSVPKQGEI